MALVITLGSASANSFQTVADAGTILSAAPWDTTAWTALTTPYKEQYLIFAAQAMDWLPLRGDRVYTDQALPFPRTHQSDTSIIPTEVKEAHAYIACLVMKPAFERLNTNAAIIGGNEVKSVDLDDVLSLTYASETLQSSDKAGSESLIRLMLSKEFPIRMKLSRHLSRFRGFGAKPRATLLAAV